MLGRSGRAIGAKTILICLSVLIFAVGVKAQDTPAVAPVSWERYKASGHDISVILPKLPNLVDGNSLCDELEKRSYFAFAENAVYEFAIAAKSKQKPPAICPVKRAFGDMSLKERLAALRSANSEMEVVDAANGSRQIYKFSGKYSTRWVVPDMAKDRWIEMAVTRRTSGTADDERFLTSLDFAGGSSKKIGDGSSVTLGDPNAGGSKTDDALTAAIMIVSKPRARYTDNARSSSTQGTVRLKVTLLANGGIGTVIPVTELADGLTEQAVSAAKRMVFLPKMVNGVPVSTTVTVDYGFSIF